MKKLFKISTILICSILIIGFTSCSSSRGTTTKISKGNISNTWTVSDVYLEGFPSGYEVKNVFDLAPYQDFKGSTWKLYGGNSGMITLTDGTTQNIYWSLVNDGLNPIFQFKKIDSGEKAKDVNAGYQLDIAASTKNSLTLRSPFKLLNGNVAYIVYNLVSQ
ncbi:MAG: hypothetical protein KKE39_11115 [Bacteroidetes bacterium]|nr:hypothetical protein [Bacteroidota bacterium]MBU1373785.1 hypothetical protein [Bacteroidota bacterium]MBU1483832.1 hypothetical protein [Bacteroidota bacterium]MBU1760264.1 hypothetical protein [Bacteroidota bacterium]MBU2268636.1 hypothetical protein [Bacteroidota bacterium]